MRAIPPPHTHTHRRVDAMTSPRPRLHRQVVMLYEDVANGGNRERVTSAFTVGTSMVRSRGVCECDPACETCTQLPAFADMPDVD